MTQRADLAVALAECRPALERYLRARGAGDETADLLQDMWLRLRTVEADQVMEPRAYLYRMAHNLLLDRARDRKRRLGREEAYQSTLMNGSLAGQPATAERALIARERLTMIDRALAALGPRTDMIFRRHRLERIPRRELARQLGISLSSVEKHLQKAYRAVAAVELRYLEADVPGEALADLPDER